MSSDTVCGNGRQAVFRFAPSPNGRLHLGHAYSALLNFDRARKVAGRFLLRIEDIDTTRCTPGFEAQMLHDLEWLGIEWDGVPRRQSEHFDDYRAALDMLEMEGLVYPSFMSRGALRRKVALFEEAGRVWPRDPDGALLYPDEDKRRDMAERQQMVAEGLDHALRLDMDAATDRVGDTLFWQESGAGPEGQSGTIACRPRSWGDVVLGRKEVPTSYHLSVVIDDALQGITDVVRGRDLFHATSVHRLLQELLGLEVPHYHHHDLILDEDGRKLSKSAGDTSLRALREGGATPDDIRRMVGLAQHP